MRQELNKQEDPLPQASLAINLGVAKVATKLRLEGEDVAKILRDLADSYDIDLSTSSLPSSTPLNAIRKQRAFEYCAEEKKHQEDILEEGLKDEWVLSRVRFAAFTAGFDAGVEEITKEKTS